MKPRPLGNKPFETYCLFEKYEVHGVHDNECAAYSKKQVRAAVEWVKKNFPCRALCEAKKVKCGRCEFQATLDEAFAVVMKK